MSKRLGQEDSAVIAMETMIAQFKHMTKIHFDWVFESWLS